MRFLFSIIFFSFFSLSAKALDVSVSHCQFINIDGNYIELHLQIIGQTVSFVHTQDSTMQQAAVTMTIYFKQGDKIYSAKKMRVESPLSEAPLDFIQMDRLQVPKGSSTLIVEVEDDFDATNRFSYSKKINSIPKSDILKQSEIQLFAGVSNDDAKGVCSKYGFNYEILPYNFAQKNLNEISFFNEIYQSDKTFSDDFLLSYKIKLGYHGELGETLKQGYRRMKPSEFIPVLQKLDISDLISGNYHLVVEVMNRKKELYASQYVNFQRSNPMADYDISNSYNEEFPNSFVHGLEEEKLNYYLRAIRPVSPYHLTGILNDVVTRQEIQAKRYFLFKYFNDQYGKSAELAFKEYMKVADVVHTQFNSGFGYGFETDRGYIFLKYGRPDDVISVEEEPSAPPYEIWVYNKIDLNNQTNVKFLFYNPSLGHNDYRLLHSTCRGERQNPAWEVELYKSALSEDNGNTINATTVKPGFNRNARKFFNDI